MFRLVLVFIFVVATTGYERKIKIPLSSKEGRIVGGENTRIEDHPYQISLQVNNEHFCGGSLIKPNVVLTAAHCMDRSVRQYSVRAGSTVVEEGGQVVQVSDVCNHPKYNDETEDYDVSVLKLKKPLQLNSAVQLINLQNAGEKVPENTMAVVTGWGALKSLEIWESGDGYYPKILQKIEKPKINQKKCQKLYRNVLNITDRMTCYGYLEGGKDSCQADSGGPLVVNGKQVGIVSWGVKCALPNFPGVYTNLENRKIHDHINKCLAKFA